MNSLNYVSKHLFNLIGRSRPSGTVTA